MTDEWQMNKSEKSGKVKGISCFSSKAFSFSLLRASTGSCHWTCVRMTQRTRKMCPSSDAKLVLSHCQSVNKFFFFSPTCKNGRRNMKTSQLRKTLVEGGNAGSVGLSAERKHKRGGQAGGIDEAERGTARRANIGSLLLPSQANSSFPQLTPAERN